MKNFSLRKNVLIKNLVIICLRSHVLPSFTKKIPFIKVLKLIKTSRNSLIRLAQTKKATKKHSSRKRKESKAAVDKRGRGKVKAHLIKKPWRKKPARYNFSKLLSASFSRDKALHNSSALAHTNCRRRRREKVSLWKYFFFAAATSSHHLIPFYTQRLRSALFVLGFRSSSQQAEGEENCEIIKYN